MKDASPEIERMVRERYLAMSPEERFLIGCQMFETARTVVLASFPTGLRSTKFAGVCASASTARA